jgi:protein-S-isoprenylcysteine O-methyltransferase Ste14
MDFPRTISRESLRPLLVATFVIVIPLVHLGCPLLLARAGSGWGWRGGHPGLLNLLGVLPVMLGFSLLGWILITMLTVAPTLPPRVRLGLRPARLVQTGPYAWMRHPIYVAEACLWVGMIVLLGSPVAAAVFACLALAGSRWIVSREERALEEEFGEEYRAYRARVPALPHFRRVR